MNYKLLTFKKEAREKLAAGADKLAQAVVSTLGPRSRNVALNRSYPAPLILHDGVSIAKEIQLRDPFEDMGAVLLRVAASKTNDLAGDGTTTATLLGNTLIQEGFKLTEGGVVEGVITGKINPMKLREDLMAYADIIIKKLEEKTIPVKKKEEYQQVATISSASPEIGKLVADALEKVGKEGVIMIEDSNSFESALEFQEGMEFENGFLSPYFATDPDKMIAEYKDGYVLMTDKKISDPMEIVNIADQVIKDANKPLLIIADDVVGAALQSLVLTKLRINAGLVAVIAPEFGERRKEMLEDIAVLTGGNVIAKDLDKKLPDVKLGELGRFRSIKVSKTNTSIKPINPDAEEITERVNAIKTQIDAEENAFKKERLEYRLSKLSQGVAIITVGGGSASEIKEKRERVIDAVNATKAAMADGIVAGGGIALLEIAEELSRDAKKDDLAFKLVYQAITAPFRTIIENAGENPDSVLKHMAALEGTNVENRGYDIVGRKVGDMIKMGITDPVKVTKLAIRHSFSVASMMLTTDTLVTDPYEDDNKKQTA